MAGIFPNPFAAIKRRIEAANPLGYKDDPMWKFANSRSLEISEDERKGHFQSAQGGGDLLTSTTAGAGWSPSRYGAVGMDPKFMAQRRLLEDEEEMYQRSGIFGMTPYGWRNA